MRFALLDPLRGLAALWVFCFHFRFSNAFQEAFPRLHQVFRHGDLGVPMFFVISGYCITAAAHNSLKNSRPAGDFLRRRVWRIYPPYWFSIAAVAAAPFAIELVSSLKTGAFVVPSADNLNYGYLHYSTWDWLRLATLLQVFQNVPEALSLQYKFTTINAVYWTLAIEVQFYIVMAAAVATRRLFVLTLWAVTALAFMSLWIPNIYLCGLFLPYWPMFAIGIVVYWLTEQMRPFRASTSHAIIKGGAIVVAMCLASALIMASLLKAPIPSLAFAVGFGLFLLSVKLLDDFYIGQIVGSRFRALQAAAWLMGALGAMSYSLYLLHGRLQFLAMQPLRQVFPADSIGFDVAVIVLTSLMCFVFYLCCERPFIPIAKSRADVQQRNSE